MSNNETGKSLSNTRINWYPGHMAKTKREIKSEEIFVNNTLFANYLVLLQIFEIMVKY